MTLTIHMAPSYVHILPHLCICSFPHIMEKLPKSMEHVCLDNITMSQHIRNSCHSCTEWLLCPYASNIIHLSTSQHIQTNQAANFTIHTIYIWDSVKIYIQFSLMGPTCIRALITKATLYHMSQPAVSQSQYHRKFTSDPSQVATFDNVSTSHNTLPSSAEVKNEWSYTSTTPTCHNGMDQKSSYRLLFASYSVLILFLFQMT